MPDDRLTAIIGADPMQVYEELGSSRKGLESERAAELLAEHGHNVLEVEKPVPMWRKFAQHLFNLFAILLWIASVLSFLSGQAALGWAIIIVILINAVFAFFQEYRAEKAVEALKKLLPSLQKVVRDGEVQQIDADTLVPGDLIVIEEGDKISADARLVASSNLRVNNSALTGEAEPVVRRSEPERLAQHPLTEMDNVVFAGTNAALGSGRGVVFATGMDTQFGKIAGLTQSVAQPPSPLQVKVAGVSRAISMIAVGIGIVFFLLGWFVLKMSVLDAVVLAIGIIVANVPEGMLPTLTMALSVSTQRMAKRHVLVKRLSSVESLGSTTVICTDKTGTLTANEMTVREVYMPGVRMRVTGVGYEPSGQFELEDAEEPTGRAEEWVHKPGAPLSAAEEGMLTELMRASALCNNAQVRRPRRPLPGPSSATPPRPPCSSPR
jgi:Ca2+-transporting ATPase